MSKQRKNTGLSSEAGGVPWRVLVILVVVGAVLYALYELNDRFKVVDVSFLDDAKAAALKSVPEKWVPEKWASAKHEVREKPEKQGEQDSEHGEQEKPKKQDSVKERNKGEGKSVNDILGGPEFSNGGAAPIHQVALQGGAPEPKVSAASDKRAPEPEIEVVPPPESSAPAPSSAPPPKPLPPKPLPPFPKTNIPTLNFVTETQSEPPPQKQSSAKTESGKAAQAEPAKAVPPPPPKPRATLLLSNVSGRLADRADVSVNMSVELAYESSNALREELEFKRDMLSTVAASVLRRHEYGSVNTAVLKTEILSVFNGHLQAGKLTAVEIKDFQVGPVAAK